MRNTDFKRRLMLLVAGCWLLVAGTFAQQKTEAATREETLQDAQKHYAAGKKLIQQGNYAAANDEFKKAQGFLEDTSLENPVSASIQPQNHQPEGRGLPSDRQSHQPDGSGGQPNSRSHRPEGRGLDGDADEALSFYLKAIDLAPKDFNLQYNLALLYLKTKQYKEAGARLEKVIQLNPEDKDAYYNLGVLYESYLGDKKKALDYYAQYIKYGPGKGDALEVKQWMRQLKKELKK